jgi:peptidoglycan-associated lipoprotein
MDHIDMLKSLFPAFAAVLMLAACSGPDSANSGSASGSGAGAGGAGGSGSRNIRPGSQEDLVANVGDRVFFDTDRATIAGSSAPARANTATLDKQAAWLKQYPQNAVTVAGNADERGTSEYNLALGQRRAQAAQAYLVAKGVAQTRINVISYGKERPTALGSNADSWSQNRNAITSVR